MLSRLRVENTHAERVALRAGRRVSLWQNCPVSPSPSKRRELTIVPPRFTERLHRGILGELVLKVTCVAASLGLSLCCGWTAAIAQQSDQDAGLYEFARNKVGLLRFCRDQGLIDKVTAEKASDAIRAGIRRIDVSSRLIKDRGDRAEAVGESGFWEVDGPHYHNDVSRRLGRTPAEMCLEVAGLPRGTPQSPAATAAVYQQPVTTDYSAQSIAPASPPPAPPPPKTYSAGPSEPSPFEVNKWRFDRRERPWGWD